MKIECPNCKLTGQVSDINIPPEGRTMDCPRCKTSFFVKKTLTANWADTVTDCPECGFSTFSAERFDICPQCGLVVKNYHQKQKPAARKVTVPADEPAVIDREQMRLELERLDREEKKKRQQYAAGETEPIQEEEQVPPAPVAPAPIQCLGWGAVLVGVVVLVCGVKGLYDYGQLHPAEAVFPEVEDPPGPFGLYLTHGLIPTLQALFGIYAAIAGSWFLKMRPGAGKGLEAAAWSGIAVAVASELVNLIASIRRASSSPSFLYYLVEFAGFMLMTALWTVPLLAAVWYMRRDVVTDAFTPPAP